MTIYEIRTLPFTKRGKDWVAQGVNMEYIVRPEHDRFRLFAVYSEQYLTAKNVKSRPFVADFDHAKQAMDKAQELHQETLKEFLRAWGRGADIKREHDNC